MRIPPPAAIGHLASRLTQNMRRAAGEFDRFQLSPREERNLPAIRRPERVVSVVASRQRLSNDRVYCPYEEKCFLLLQVDGGKCDPRAVRRDHWKVGVA